MKEELEKAEGSVQGSQEEGAWLLGLGWSLRPLSPKQGQGPGYRGTLLGLLQGERVPMRSVWMARSPGDRVGRRLCGGPPGLILWRAGELRLLLQAQPRGARQSVMQQFSQLTGLRDRHGAGLVLTHVGGRPVF